MTRIFTFGCSFTKYSWHTYADLLAEAFYDQKGIFPNHLIFQNWGAPGLGNRAIAERVIECHHKNCISKEDIVIVQWSGHLRYDYLKFNTNAGTAWQTNGSVLAEANEHIYNKHWMKTFFDEKAMFIHTLNNISLVQNLLENIGCKWLMTSMSDLEKNDFGHETISGEYFYENNADLECYAPIWKNYNSNWLSPMINFKSKHKELDWWFNKIEDSDTFEIFKSKKVPVYETTKDKFLEGHLTPEQHLFYLEDVLEKVGLEAKVSNRVLGMMNWYRENKTDNLLQTITNIHDKWFKIKMEYGF